MSSSSTRRRRRVWRFSDAEFDEASWALRVDGQVVVLEGKPLEVLHELLLRAGEVVTKQELLEAVWPGVHVVEGSLATAVSKLRKALGEPREAIIETVPRIGYRLSGPVTSERIEAPIAARFDFRPDEAVSGRPQWRLDRPLGDTGAQDVWLARHTKTEAQRVFKFAEAADRLRSLKREAALSRLVTMGLGPEAPVPLLLEWNFEEAPYFLEYAFGGDDLTVWANAAGGLGQISLEQRIGVAARACRAVAQIHGLGILHKDLKPENILLEEDASGLRLRLADLGSGRLLDDALLDSLRISDPAVLEASPEMDDSRSGTLAYRAPEVAAGAAPTAQSDIYALGLILYQLVVGDFQRPLAPGWEADIKDPVLREDIALASEGVPSRRLASAADLADRLETLDERRKAAAVAAERAAWLEAQEAAEARRSARRPWILAAVASLAAGLVFSLAFAFYALHQRNEALAAQRISEASYRFIAEDVLASVNPNEAASAEETLVEAIIRSAETIGQRFEDDPLVAAYLYGILGRAFDLRSDYTNAFRYYEEAQRSYVRAGAGGSAEALNTRLQFAGALALSTQPGSLERARSIVADVEQLSAGGQRLEPETRVWLNSAQGMIALVGEDVPVSRDHFQRAYEGARQLPQTFSERQILNFGQRYAFSLIRLGEGPQAEAAFVELVDGMTELVGPDHPDTLLLRLNLAQTYLIQQRFDDVITDLDRLMPLLEERLGDDHRLTLLALAARQQALGAVGRYDQAAADGERLWRAAAAKDGASSFAAVAGRTDTGVSQCRAGQLQTGADNISAALEALRTELAGREVLEGALRAALADCYIGMGRYGAARDLLQDIDRVGVNQLVGDPSWGFQVDLALAEIALGEGDVELAGRHFAQAREPLSSAQDIFVRQRLERMAAALEE